jgi:hypothetical protein
VANNMNVSLDNKNGVDKLDVADHGGENQVSQSPNPTTISWNLTGAIAQGCFSPMSASLPGFSWVGTPPPAGLFGTPTISANGNSLSITDNHHDASSNGSWIYMLRVDYKGNIVSTTATLPSGTSTNPAIINR